MEKYIDEFEVVFSSDRKTLIRAPESIEKYDIPNSVTMIGDMAFMDCNYLTSIIIPDSVAEIGEWAFSYCIKLASIIIPESVTEIGYCAFWSCKNLSSIIIPDSVIAIRGRAFS